MDDSEGVGGDGGIEPGIHTDFSSKLSYGELLRLDDLLSLQRPLKGRHDEVLFIVIHQTTELWIKLMIHEIKGAIGQHVAVARYRLENRVRNCGLSTRGIRQARV